MSNLVRVSNYRRRLLQGKVAVRLQRWCHEAAKINWWRTEEEKVLPDHVHLLIQKHPMETVGVQSFLAVKRYSKEHWDIMLQPKRSLGL